MLTECPWDQRCKSEECASLCAHGKLCELMWADIYKTTYCVPLTLSEDGCVNAHGRDHDWCVTIINQRIKSTWVAQLSTSLLCISSSNVFNSNIGMLSEKCHFSLRAQRVELTLQTEAVQLKLIFSVYTEGNSANRACSYTSTLHCNKPAGSKNCKLLSNQAVKTCAVADKGAWVLSLSADHHLVTVL